jgi:membrane protease YdiL (CAAX protease family)
VTESTSPGRRALALARTVVYNDAERRPRAPVRLLAHLLVVLLVGVALAVGLRTALLAAGAGSPSPLWSLLLDVVVSGGAVVVATAVAVRYLDRRTLADVGLTFDRTWWRDLAAGLALGAALQTAVLLTYVAAGWTTVRAVGAGGADLLLTLVVGAVVMVVVGSYEELLFRGYWLNNVAEGVRALPRVDAQRAVLAATALTSVVFGLAHGVNPGATAVSTALVVGYGAYLAVGYLLTGDLALPVGFHVAWNYVQGFVYGFPVSGIDVEATLLSTTTTGPRALTGGSFGPEAGVVGAAWVLASLPAIWTWVGRTRGAARLREDLATPSLRDER